MASPTEQTVRYELGMFFQQLDQNKNEHIIPEECSNSIVYHTLCTSYERTLIQFADVLVVSHVCMHVC
jgi:hypothetical protein